MILANFHTKKKLFIHVFILASFLIYAFFLADPLFSRLEQSPHEAISASYNLPESTNNLRYHFEKWATVFQAIEIHGWAFIRGVDSKKGQISIVLKSDSKQYIFETMPEKRADVTTIFNKTGLNLDDAGFVAVIPLQAVEIGKYQIAIHIKKGEAEALQYTYNGLVRQGDNIEMISWSVSRDGEGPSLDPYTMGLSSSLKVVESSFQAATDMAQALVDSNDETYWHVDNPPLVPVHWVTFDFGEPVAIGELALLPRRGHIHLLWDMGNAVLQGSSDGSESWVLLSSLPLDKKQAALKGWDWLVYTIPNSPAYRYYRIVINDPEFLSLAEVKFGAKVPTVSWAKWTKVADSNLSTGNSGTMMFLKTSGREVAPTETVDALLDNERGTTAEVKLKLKEAPAKGDNGAVFSVMDGKREGKVSFYPDRIVIRDRNDWKAEHLMDTSHLHTYRVSLVKETLRVYVDGGEVAAINLMNDVKDKKVLFGDFSREASENLNALFEYLVYSDLAALTPEEIAITPLPREVVPISPITLFQQNSIFQGQELKTEEWAKYLKGINVNTTGGEVDTRALSEEKLNNEVGTTAEVKMKVIDAPATGFNGAIFSIIDGTREGKLSFFRNRVELRDQNDLMAVYEIDTTVEFNIYRMTILGNALTLYVNSENVASITLSNIVTSKKILFGDFSSEIGENANLLVSYLAYSVTEARTP